MSAAFMAMKCIDQIAPPPSATAAPSTQPSAASRPRACGNRDGELQRRIHDPRTK
jgi:hypothetical protein